MIKTLFHAILHQNTCLTSFAYKSAAFNKMSGLADVVCCGISVKKSGASLMKNTSMRAITSSYVRKECKNSVKHVNRHHLRPNEDVGFFATKNKTFCRCLKLFACQRLFLLTGKSLDKNPNLIVTK